jgi:enterochelin esterase family protein
MTAGAHAARPAAVACAAVLFAACGLAVGCGSEPESVRELLQDVRSMDAPEGGAAIERFIARRGGTPIIEGQTRAVFLVQDQDGETPRIVGDFNDWAASANGQDPNIGTPTRIEGTDWSYLDATIYTNARAEYVLLFDTETRPDPHNPRLVQAFSGVKSEVRMPHWTPQPEIDETGVVPTGAVAEETIMSRSLGAPRRVWFYTPPGYGSSDEWYPVVYFLDGGSFVERMDAPQVLDRLISRKAIPPVVAVFVEPSDRKEEYTRNANWRAFITSELVPLVDGRFKTFAAPEKRVILGSSLSAYGAVDLAVEHPSIFGLCAALAPPVQARTVITNQTKGLDAVRAVRFFVLAGTYDSMANGARLLRTALDMQTGAVTYLEVPEGHSTETFRGHLDDALSTLLN